MSRPRRGPAISKDDGLPARWNGGWAKEKLDFLDQYLPPALIATRRMLQRYYVDLFAGPGRNVDYDTKEEFEGGAIRALKATDGKTPPTGFTHLVAVNLDKTDHEALGARIQRVIDAGETRVPPTHIERIHGDTNSHVDFIMRKIHKLAYVVVFADPDNPSQLPFTTLAALRQQGHRSVDLYVLFPSDMAIRRLVANPSANERVLTRFFGDTAWRPLADARKTDAQFPELMRQLRELYMTNLRALGWAFVTHTKIVRRTGSQSLYDMIFATNHPAGERIGQWAADERRSSDQIGMDFG